MAWPFVAREADLRRVVRLLRARPPVGVVLAGPQGVGKSRLALAARTAVADAGVTVRHAVAGTATAGLPFGALATLLPVSRELPDSPQAGFRAAVDHLVAEAGEGTLVVSIDDAHHLDETSAALLLQLAATPRVTVLLTLRSDLPAPDGVRTLWRSEGVERFDLGPLDDDAVAAVLDGALDGDIAPGTVRALVRLSAGNPLYLRELVTGSLASGTLAVTDGLWQLATPATTPRLVDIVEERLAALGDDERRALELVALAGDLGYDLLAGLVGEGPVEALERAGLVGVDHDGRRRVVTVGHAVHGDVVRQQLTTAQAARRHGEIADAIEAADTRRRDDVLRIAVARLAAGGDVSAPVMAEAARRALVAFDLDLAERLARIAVDAGAGIAARLDLGITLTRAGRQREADAVFAAIDLDGATDEERALVAIGWSDCLFWGLGDGERAVATVAAARAVVTEPAWLDQLVVTTASYELLGGHPAVAEETLRTIVADGTARGVAAAGLIAGVSLSMLGRAEEALDLVERAWEARAEIEEGFGLVYEGMLVVTQTVALGELGRLDEAEAVGTVAHDAAVAAGVDYGRAWLALNLSRALRFARPPGEGARWAREGATAFEALGIPPLRRWCLYGAAWLHALAGDRAAATEAVTEARAVPTGPVLLMEPETLRAEAAIALLGHDRAEALRLVDEAVELAAKLELRTQELGALHDLVRLGQADRALPRVEALADEVDGALAAAIVAHTRAAAAGDAEALGAVADRFAGLGATLLAAEAAAQGAGAATALGDGRRARRLAERAGDLAAGLGGPVTPALADAAGAAQLTDREREIAELAARRIPSKEIAQRLTLSRRTVDNHLHRIYNKLGVGGRDDLRDALGLPPD